MPAPLLICLLILTLGLSQSGLFLLLAWLGGNFAVLAVGLLLGKHCLFGKRPNGTLPWWSWLFFAPLHGYTFAVWHLIRWLSREPAINQISENLSIGRRLLSSEVSSEFDHFIDLTAEFPEPAAIRKSPAYRSFPLLDTSAPQSEALRKFLTNLPVGRIYIHCAQGHGRTGLFAVALLLHSGQVKNIADGLALIQAARPGVRLNVFQRQCLVKFEKLLKTGQS